MKKIFYQLMTIAMLLPVATMADGDPFGLPYPNVAPQSPINMTTDLYSGRLNLQVPLITINTKGLSIPISLVYQGSSGIKLNVVHSSWVGLGWELSGTGKITRIVRGTYADDVIEHGYVAGDFGKYAEQSPDDPNSSWCKNELGGIGNLLFYSKRKDFEPDLFFFELPGGTSGMFVLDHFGKAYTIPYQNIKIDPHVYQSSLAITSFTITDAKGVQYEFRTPDTQYSTIGGSDRWGYAPTWYINQISVQGKKVVTFKYDETGSSYTYIWDNFFKKITLQEDIDKDGKVIPGNPQTDPPLTHVDRNGKFYDAGGGYSLNYTLQQIPKYLSSITWNEGSLTFTSTEGLRADKKELRLLTDIQLKDRNNELLKTTNFLYTNFANLTPSLYGVCYTYPSGEEEDVCKFTYNRQVNLPTDFSGDFDAWGYFLNIGHGNEGRTPRLEANGNIVDLFRITRGDPDPAGVQANILTRIDYPGGAYTEFTYEGNKAYRQSDNTIISQVGGVRIAKIVNGNKNGDVTYTKTFSYVNPNGTPSGTAYIEDSNFDFNRPKAMLISGGYLPLYPGNEFQTEYGIDENNPYDRPLTDINGLSVFYSYVKETLPGGEYNIYEFYSYKDHPDSLSLFQCVYDQDNVDKYVVNHGFPPYIRYVATSQAWARGMLKRLSHYKMNGELVSATKYNYDFGKPARKRIWGAVIGAYPQEIDIPNYVGRYSWVSKPVVLSSVETEKTAYNQYSKTEYVYDEFDTLRYMVPLQILQTDAEGNITKTEITYPFSEKLRQSQGFASSPYQKMLENNMIVPIEKITSLQRNDGSFKYLSGEVNAYQVKDANTVLPQASYKLQISTPLLSDPSPSINTSGQLIPDSKYYKVAETFDSYDSENRVTTHRSGEYAPSESFIYDDDDNVIATVTGANANAIFYTSFENGSETKEPSKAKTGNYVHVGTYSADVSNMAAGLTYILTYWKSSDQGTTWTKVITQPVSINPATKYTIGSSSTDWIDEVSILPANAQITTYAYDSAGNKISESDDNGHTQYWEYDGRYRLTSVLNNDKQVVKEYKYSTKNQGLIFVEYLLYWLFGAIL